MKLRSRIASVALAAAGFAALPASAVYLDPGGLGQALIYPYYTAQSTGTAFNTLISVVNRSTDAKVIRVRFREGRNAREVASFNLYLGSLDTWTGALVADAGGARFLTSDLSCVNPAFAPSVDGGTHFFEFSDAGFTGINADNLGTGAERQREGFIEMIEMATLTGASAAAVNPPPQPFVVTPTTGPSNCAAVQGTNVALQVSPPTGNLSGTLTLINVATGMNFTVNAVALARLSTRAFYRDYPDPYPDFTAAEVDPVSILTNPGNTARTTWNNGVDAVASVLMSSTLGGETILDSGTRSGTEWVVTFPLRPFRQPGTVSRPPVEYPAPPATSYPRAVGSGYNSIFQWTPRDGGPTVSYGAFDFSAIPPGIYDVDLALPWAVTVMSFAHGARADAGPVASSSVLGSVNAEKLTLQTSAEDGTGTFSLGGRMAPTSASIFDHAAGTTSISTAGLDGAPAIGFWVRTFLNGTLTCGANTCLGNYGGAYPFVTTRSVLADP